MKDLLKFGVMSQFLIGKIAVMLEPWAILDWDTSQFLIGKIAETFCSWFSLFGWSQFLIGKIAVEGFVITFRIIHHILHRVKVKMTKAPGFGFRK